MVASGGDPLVVAKQTLAIEAAQERSFVTGSGPSEVEVEGIQVQVKHGVLIVGGADGAQLADEPDPNHPDGLVARVRRQVGRALPVFAAKEVARAVEEDAVKFVGPVAARVRGHEILCHGEEGGTRAGVEEVPRVVAAGGQLLLVALRVALVARRGGPMTARGVAEEEVVVAVVVVEVSLLSGVVRLRAVEADVDEDGLIWVEHLHLPCLLLLRREEVSVVRLQLQVLPAEEDEREVRQVRELLLVEISRAFGAEPRDGESVPVVFPGWHWPGCGRWCGRGRGGMVHGASYAAHALPAFSIAPVQQFSLPPGRFLHP